MPNFRTRRGERSGAARPAARALVSAALLAAAVWAGSAGPPSPLGLPASYFLDTSSAGTVVVAQGLVFAVAYLVAPRRGLVATRRRRRRAAVPAAVPAAGTLTTEPR